MSTLIHGDSTLDAAPYIRMLASAPGQLRGLLEPLDSPAIYFRPQTDQWSIAEIVGHMADEEPADFRARTCLLLEAPDLDWPPIDPPRWVIERGHQSKSIASLLEAFERERAMSLEWLKSLREPNWASTKTHPKFGTFTAGGMLVAWAAHDILHFRQITKRLYQYAASLAPGARIDYAGDFI